MEATLSVDANEPCTDASLIENGTRLLCIHPVDLFESVTSWYSVGTVDEGAIVVATGPVVLADGIETVPVEMNSQSGAVELSCFRIHELAPGAVTSHSPLGVRQRSSAAEGEASPLLEEGETSPPMSPVPLDGLELLESETFRISKEVFASARKECEVSEDTPRSMPELVPEKKLEADALADTLADTLVDTLVLPESGEPEAAKESEAVHVGPLEGSGTDPLADVSAEAEATPAEEVIRKTVHYLLVLIFTQFAGQNLPKIPSLLAKNKGFELELLRVVLGAYVTQEPRFRSLASQPRPAKQMRHALDDLSWSLGSYFNVDLQGLRKLSRPAEPLACFLRTLHHVLAVQLAVSLGENSGKRRKREDAGLDTVEFSEQMARLQQRKKSRRDSKLGAVKAKSGPTRDCNDYSWLEVYE